MKTPSPHRAFQPERFFTVIVNWNLVHDTLSCIDSLLAAGLLPSQIVLVDNASTDGSVDAIRNRYQDQIRLVRSQTNLGFAGGVNLGVGHALEHGADWIFLLNNDAVVDEQLLSVLDPFLDPVAQHAAFGPAIYHDPERERIWFFGDRLIYGTLFTFSLFKNRSLPGDLPDRVKVDFLNGCGMVVPAELFREIGGFDTGLFMYGEEVDFCWRARQEGFQFWSIPDARIWHKVSTSSSRNSDRQVFLQLRNQTWFYRRSCRGMKLAVMFLGSFARTTWLTFRRVFTGSFRTIGSMWRGWWEGWTAEVPARRVSIISEEQDHSHPEQAAGLRPENGPLDRPGGQR